MEIEIVTPAGRVLQAQADEVTVPGVLGELGLLPGHIPIITALDVGHLVVRTGNVEERFVVDGGFLELAHDRVNVITELAVRGKDVDVASVEQERRAAEAALKGSHELGPAEQEARLRALRRAEALLEAARRTGR